MPKEIKLNKKLKIANAALQGQRAPAAMLCENVDDSFELPIQLLCIATSFYQAHLNQKLNNLVLNK